MEIVDLDPNWISAFEKEAAMLRSIFGERLIDVHHIGSTAVPRLPAKPIIDILVVLDDTSDINSFNSAMEALGYRVRGECLDAPVPGTPGRFYFSKETNGVRSHHVHVCAKGHQEIFDKLAFRDYLRMHEDVAAAYVGVKRRAAVEHRFDNIGYMHAKDGFVKAALADARRWYETKGERFNMSIELRGVCTLLQIFDMPASVRFYRDVLGFEIVQTTTPREGDQFDWGLLRLDNVEVMLNTAHERQERPAQPDSARVAAHRDTCLYFGCPDVDGAYRHLQAQGIDVEEPEIAPWGAKQLYVRDPDGYQLCFQWRAE
jgi:GrpB-like predicted nucleotidyltransferase (UPF0157 family)/catechol 2,3-dioxygenase-like lactoylglutathione lyase family enzyme